MLHKRNGVLPEALLNFVIRLGWSHGNDEVISREQMVEWFDFDHVGTTSGVWNPDKLHVAQPAVAQAAAPGGGGRAGSWPSWPPGACR